MSVNRSQIAFEGFLQKRKDNLKMRWVTYWFRLQDTALSFYTKKNGSASHLKGQYYLISFHSVQEVQRSERKRFMFVITMTNGKNKVLAAETAALRQQWVEHVCKAMNLSSNSVCDTPLDLCDQFDDVNSSSASSSLSNGRIDPLSLHTDSEVTTCKTHECLSEFRALNTEEEEKKREDGDYDVLPCRNKVCEQQLSEECVYDVPQSYRSSTECQESRESVYDVPSSLMRKLSVYTSDEDPEEETYWRI